jgi:carboxypeptidase C (cathepsin A)
MTQPASRESASEKQEATTVTRHAVTVSGHELRYTATAGFLDIRDDEGKIEASIFYVAYVKDGQRAAERPITFAFNGGPGAASLWLHLGAMGPKRVVLPDDGTSFAKAVRLADNESTWLAFTDAVFIDPVGSGYSTAAAGVDPKRFYGVQGDVQSVGEFIRLFISRTGRWSSPKFLVGESYGTTRAAALARWLAKHYGMNVNGLILLSSALNFQTLVFSKENDLPYMLSLPAYTAVAWYHHKLSPEMQKDLDKALDLAEEWTVNEYGPALARGSDLPASQRKKIVDSLHQFTSLPETYIERSDLRIPSSEFAKELLRDEGRLVGILDGRVTGFPVDTAKSSVEYDPALASVSGPFAAAIQDYLRSELGFRVDQRYVFLSAKANESWNWGSAAEGFVNVTDDLQQAMTEDPHLKVFAGMGCFDLTTSYFGQRYTFNHLGLASPLRGNLRIVRYPSGHQIYTQDASRRKLSADVGEFILSACSPTTAPAR